LIKKLIKFYLFYDWVRLEKTIPRESYFEYTIVSSSFFTKLKYKFVWLQNKTNLKNSFFKREKQIGKFLIAHIMMASQLSLNFIFRLIIKLMWSNKQMCVLHFTESLSKKLLKGGFHGIKSVYFDKQS